MVALALTGASAARGWRNGLSAEFYRLFRLGVSLVAGTSLYGLLSDAATDLLNIRSGLADPALFLGTTFGVWSLLRRARRWMEALILAKVPSRWQNIGGAVAAALKTAALVGGTVTLFNLADWLPGHDAIANESVAGRIVQTISPAP